MAELDARNVRLFRLREHHLDQRYEKEHVCDLVGACGMQNSPPGAWETALFNRVAHCPLPEMEALLYADKSLLQTWSFRGAPVVFPAGESGVFLSALVPAAGEEWIYTHGISAALDCLGMTFTDLLKKLQQVIPGLDQETVVSKSALDQLLAEWMLPLIPAEKQLLWQAPSMYGRPELQTVGGAVVSFLLRPCSLLGLVAFGQRHGSSPTFTSYRGWLGRPLQTDPEGPQKLVRKFLHCYGPATVDSFRDWLGCGRKQAQRLWSSVRDEVEPVALLGKEALILSRDRELLSEPPPPPRELLLLGGHDPYLDQRDRHILLADQKLHRQVWKTVANPGAVVRNGEIIGIWAGKLQGKGMEIKITLWKKDHQVQRGLPELAEEYAAFRQHKLIQLALS